MKQLRKPPKLCLIYVTTPDLKSAERIGKTLVRERLAACANILDSMQSIYEWKGKLEKTSETVLILKTRSTLFKSASKRIQSLHPYECPCVLELPIQSGTAPYTAWLLQQTQ